MFARIALREVSIGIAALLGAATLLPNLSHAQTALKKTRMALPSSNVTFLAFIAAKENGYYKDEGFHVEFILMQPTLASTAVLTGDIDYNGAVSGVVTAAVRGQPIKAVVFTNRSPLQTLMARKEISDLRQLKGKKIGTDSPGGTTDLLAKHVLKQAGLEFGRDYSIVYVGPRARLVALETGSVDASIVAVPENILARQKGFNELAFGPDYIEFPQAGFGASTKKIGQNPEEVYRMVRATLRGLMLVADKKNKEVLVDMIMKNWNVKTRAIAAEMYDYLAKVLPSGGSVSMQGVQNLVDQARESAKVIEPVDASQVVDLSFMDKAGKELGLRP